MSRRKEKKEIIDLLEIEAIAFEGISIARCEGLVHFLPGGVPGDKVRALRLRKRKNRLESLILEVLEPSPHRIEAKCNYFGDCGGCSQQNMNYQKQLQWKKTHVKDAFERHAKIFPEEILDVSPAPKEFYYRNKMEFSFGGSRWLTKAEVKSGKELGGKNFALGLHAKGRYDKVIDVKECHITDSRAGKILELLRSKAQEHDVPAYNLRTGEGFLRELGFRVSSLNGEILVNLITFSGPDSHPQFMDWFYNDFPTESEVSTIIHSVNGTKSPVDIERSTLVCGPGFLKENILGIDYKISPRSFFQTNTFGLNAFIEKIIEYAQAKTSDIVWDLYCGAGSITLPLAKNSKKIIGIEMNSSAVDDAKENAKENEIHNAYFYVADLHGKQMPELLSSLEKPDIVIIDPPRAGVHKNLLAHLLDISPKTIVYVSCNPMTQSRDCKILEEKYIIKKILPFDMFPQTWHIESIALLQIREKLNEE